MSVEKTVSRRQLVKTGSVLAGGITFLGIGLLSRSAKADCGGGGCSPCGTSCSAGCSDGGCDTSPCLAVCAPGVGVA